MDREDWKELEPEIMREGATSLIRTYEGQIAVLQDKVTALKKYLEARSVPNK